MNEIINRPRPRKPANETERLRALRALTSLSSAREPEYDTIAELAAITCETPMAAISFIDAERAWTKASFGMGPGTTEAPRSDSFCGYAILSQNLLEVSDTHDDFRFAENPYVTGEPFIRFYAGAPLMTTDGYAIGALCVIDRVARTLSDRQRTALQKFAAHVVAMIELRYRMQRLPLPRAHRGRILIAEDSRVNQMITQRLLEKLGFQADVVPNGLAAIDALAQQPYDLVLMDCHMPQLDGFGATRVIRARESRRLPIIALTGSAERDDRERCLQSGMDDVIEKPVREHDLDAALKKWLPELEEFQRAAM